MFRGRQLERVALTSTIRHMFEFLDVVIENDKLASIYSYINVKSKLIQIQCKDWLKSVLTSFHRS